jgi:hypothetical protein
VLAPAAFRHRAPDHTAPTPHSSLPSLSAQATTTPAATATVQPSLPRALSASRLFLHQRTHRELSTAAWMRTDRQTSQLDGQTDVQRSSQRRRAPTGTHRGQPEREAAQTGTHRGQPDKEAAQTGTHRDSQADKEAAQTGARRGQPGRQRGSADGHPPGTHSQADKEAAARLDRQRRAHPLSLQSRALAPPPPLPTMNSTVISYINIWRAVQFRIPTPSRQRLTRLTGPGFKSPFGGCRISSGIQDGFERI